MYVLILIGTVIIDQQTSDDKIKRNRKRGHQNETYYFLLVEHR